MTRVAAVDCGTNSIRLLVLERDGEAATELDRRSEVVRLGEGVDATGRLADGALERVERRCREYARACTDLGVEQVVFAATSATRDASNAAALDAVVERCFARWSTGVTVLSGDREARLTYLGAADAVRSLGITGSVVVVDIGGGSTELVRGAGEQVHAAVSLDVGAVRLHERLAPADPLAPDDVLRVEHIVDEALERGLARVPLAGAAAVVGVAGTATTVAAHQLALPRYDSRRVHLAQSTPAATARAARRLAGLTGVARSELAYVEPGREDVLATGALVWARVLERAAGAGVPLVVVSESDLLDALARRVGVGGVLLS